MKTKTYKKKLTLNKKTVAHLKNGEMNGIHGGGDAPIKSVRYYPCLTDMTCNTTC
jgi:hypothetical protein